MKRVRMSTHCETETVQHSLDVIGAEVLRQFRGDLAPGVTESPVALAAEEEEIG